MNCVRVIVVVERLEKIELSVVYVLCVYVDFSGAFACVCDARLELSVFAHKRASERARKRPRLC